MTLVTRDVAPVSASQGSSEALWRALIFVPCFTVLSILIPALLVMQVSDAGRSSAWGLALLVAAWSGLRLSMLLAGGEARFFAFFIWLFTYIFMGIAPAVQIRSNQPSRTTPDVLPSLDNPTMLVVILGLVAFEVATFLSWLTSRRLAHRAPAATNEVATNEAATHEAVSEDRAGVRPVAVIVLAAAGVAVSAYYISRVGLPALLTSRDAAALGRFRAWVDPAIRAIIFAVTIYPLLVAVGGLERLRHATRWPLTRLIYLLLTLGGAAVLLVVVNPISSPRYTLGTVLFALAVLFGAANTRSRTRFTMAAVIFGLFFLFPLADAFRLDQANFSRAGFFGEYGANPDYDSVWQVANAMTYWDSGVATPGFQALGLPFFWTPRALWPGKPLDTGVVLATANGYNTTNLSAPLWAEALVNGGLVAVVLVFLVLGLVIRRLDSRVVSALSPSPQRRAGAVWVIAGAVFPPYFMILMRGSLLQATGAVAVMIACLLIVRRADRQRRAHSPPSVVG